MTTTTTTTVDWLKARWPNENIVWQSECGYWCVTETDGAYHSMNPFGQCLSEWFNLDDAILICHEDEDMNAGEYFPDEAEPRLEIVGV